MQQSASSGPPGKPDQKNIEEEKKKLDEDLKAGKITQAEHFKQMQKLTGGSPPTTPAPTPAPTPAGPPQLPPATGAPMHPSPITVKTVGPITPISPLQPGPKEEVPPIGQALAVGSEDIEVVECYKCGGLITITTKQRPVIIACPSCGTKGEVDAEELAPALEETAGRRATEAQTLDEGKLFKFASEDHAEMPQPKGPTFGSTLDEDLAKQDSPSSKTVKEPKKTE